VFASARNVRTVAPRASLVCVRQRPVAFSISPPGGDRIHHIAPDDVRVVLGRLPNEVYGRLRAVHFNDRSRARVLGYVNRGRREIGLCALPPRLSLTGALRGQSPTEFGARRGEQWPELAVRRYLLYHVLLHEIGHLQVIHPGARVERRKFAMEPRAERFADHWRGILWSEPFEHPDRVHRPPAVGE